MRSSVLLSGVCDGKFADPADRRVLPDFDYWSPSGTNANHDCARMTIAFSWDGPPAGLGSIDAALHVTLTCYCYGISHRSCHDRYRRVAGLDRFGGIRPALRRERH